MSNKKRYTLVLAASETTEMFTIKEREFWATPLVINDVVALEKVEDTDSQAAYLARILTARAVDGQPVTEEWINSTITRVDAVKLGTFLIHGEVRDPN